MTPLDARPSRQPRRALDFREIANPLGPSAEVRAALAAFDPATRPDPTWTGLREALAERLAAPVERLRADEDVLALAARAFARPGRRALVLTPAPVRYREGVVAAAGEALELSARRQGSAWRWDIRALGASWKGLGASCAVVGRPADPTGAILGLEDVGRLAALVWPAPLVVDEGLLPFVARAESASPLVEQHPNLLVVQSLSRAHGLGSLSVEWCLAQPALFEDFLAAARLPGTTTAAAQAAGLAALATGDGHLRDGMRTATQSAQEVRGACLALDLPVVSSPHAAWVAVRLRERTRHTLAEQGFLLTDAGPMGVPGVARIAPRRVAVTRELVRALTEAVGRPE